MKKRIILSLALTALLIAIFAISVSAADPVETWDISQTSSDNVTAYLYNDENNAGYYTLTISGTGDMKNWTYYSSAPWYSSYGSKITSVTIEESVTSIGNYAFYDCSNLTSVELPEGVTSIGESAFKDCRGLTSIVIPEGVTTIGGYAFRECSSLTSIELPEGVTSIGYYAFYGCSSLTSVELPKGVTYIGGYAFEYCYSLTSVELPEGVTSIGTCAFSACDSLTSIVIPEGVTSIGESAFSGCSSLTSIVIPESVTYIGYHAFSCCYNITIYCEAESQPSGWNTYWNSSNRSVVWGYEYETVYLEDIFTFKGYSFSANGGFAVGFAIDYDALAKYEAKTGKTLEIGVVFAGYDNLGGKQPLDQNGEAIELDRGVVKKAEITSLGYKYYDFMLTGLDDSIKDIKLVIAGYIFDGEAVKYVQSNGISDAVRGISYICANGGHSFCDENCDGECEHYVIEVESTCTNVGLKRYICMECGDYSEVIVMPELECVYEKGGSRCEFCGRIAMDEF